MHYRCRIHFVFRIKPNERLPHSANDCVFEIGCDCASGCVRPFAWMKVHSFNDGQHRQTATKNSLAKSQGFLLLLLLLQPAA